MTELEQAEHDKAEIADLKSMIETPGWVAFARQHKQRAEDLRLNSWNIIKTTAQLHYLKGFIEALEALANYENILVAAEAQIPEPDAFQTE